MNAPWVFAEAYKYRRLRECFSTSKYWKDYDVFFRQKVRAHCQLFRGANRSSKCDTFSRSQDAVFELSMRFAEAFELPPGLDEQAATEKERLMFHELTQSPCSRFTENGSIWGTDLTLQSVSGATPPTFRYSST